MTDLGVDVRDEPLEDLIARYAPGLEAVVVSGPDADTRFDLERQDGSSIPLVITQHDRDDSVVARVALAGRRAALSSVSTGVRMPARADADLEPLDRTAGPLEGTGEGVPGTPKARDERRRGTRRQVRQAVRHVRHEY